MTILSFVNNELNLNSNHGNDVLIILRSLDESNERKNLFKNKINKFSYLMKRDQR